MANPQAHQYTGQFIATLVITAILLVGCSSDPSATSSSTVSSASASTESAVQQASTESRVEQTATESSAQQPPADSATKPTPAESVDEQTPSVTSASGADLGLATPITEPTCDGTGVVVISTFSNPSTYAADVARALAQHPGSRYMRTDRSCSSFAPATLEGNQIYVVYIEAGHEKDQVCELVRQLGGRDVFGKWLDQTSAPNETIQC